MPIVQCPSLAFRLVASDFPGIVCIIDGDRSGVVELKGSELTMPCCRPGRRATRMVGCPQRWETKQDANLMRPCLALSIVAQFLSMIAEAPAVAGEPIAAPSVASVRIQAVDRSVRRVQAEPAEIRMSCSPLWDVPSDAISVIGGPSISLQMALYRTLTSNPDLNLLRLGNPTTPSAESVEVARHFPSTLNPTLWIDYRPMILIPFKPFGRPGRRRCDRGPFIIGGSSTSTCPSANRSSWDIRRRTAIILPRRPTISSAGPSSRPSSWRWFRPTASFRRLSTGARSSGSPRSLPSSTRRSSHH